MKPFPILKGVVQLIFKIIRLNQTGMDMQISKCSFYPMSQKN